MVARETVVRFEPRARSFGVSLETESDGPAAVWGDGDRILQVVSNLVENALRITPTGGKVTIRAAPGELSVSDTGPGLAPDEASRAFERFFLFNRYRGERAVGTGLGLAIVKQLTQAMGGTVGVRSSPGAGTTFTVRFPVVTPAERAREPVPRSSSS
jgi:signal transduction histidine kinase